MNYKIYSVKGLKLNNGFKIPVEICGKVNTVLIGTGPEVSLIKRELVPKDRV